VDVVYLGRDWNFIPFSKKILCILSGVQLGNSARTSDYSSLKLLCLVSFVPYSQHTTLKIVIIWRL
jgi:hypothetical protein